MFMNRAGTLLEEVQTHSEIATLSHMRTIQLSSFASHLAVDSPMVLY